ncbi:MAG: archaellin/type IV pilin N-terminal domain-containing protein [Nanoarchaeota archaeon]
MLNKKGISPLITTILLISFVVAFGASFVTFAGSYYQGSVLNKSVECKDYLINFIELNKENVECASKSKFPYALAVSYKNEPWSDFECYTNKASATSRVCDTNIPLGKIWVPETV